jgi:peptidoglycan/xylan/chitin deacetylase (PgdA/CDA1 family)
MAEEHGPDFLEWMLEAGCEVASHGYVHDLNRLYGGDRVYAGHYGRKENLDQVRMGIEAIHRFFPGAVRGVRMPYGHFNEFTYDALEQSGVVWSSNVGIDDMLRPGQGFGPMPFAMRLGDRAYPIVEIPLDTQTYDWTIWMADEGANRSFVEAVRTYASRRGLVFDRSYAGGVSIWRERMREAVENQTSFTLLCHPINLAPRDSGAGDPVSEFLFPVIDRLEELRRENKAWVCTCGQMADFYRLRTGLGEKP